SQRTVAERGGGRGRGSREDRDMGPREDRGMGGREDRGMGPRRDVEAAGASGFGVDADVDVAEVGIDAAGESPVRAEPSEAADIDAGVADADGAADVDE